MKKKSKRLKFFLSVFIVLALFFFVSSRVVAFENSFDYVSGISYEPIAKLVNFLNDKKSELERYGDRLGKPNIVKRSVYNTNNANAKKSFLLSAVLETAKDAIVGKPKKYFGKVFCVTKDFIFPGACRDESIQDYNEETIQPERTSAEDISAIKQQYDGAIREANILNQKFNALQQELGKIKAGGVIIKEPIIEQKTVERTIEKIVSGLSQDDLSAGIASLRTELNNLNTNLTNQINNLSSNTSRQTTAVYQAVSLTNRIDNLTGTSLTRITVNGVTGLTDSDIPDGITASNYLPLIGGTITGDLTINGNATLGVITLQNATAGYFTATSTAQASTFPYASTTALTVSGSAYIGSINGPLQANGGLVSATTSIGYQYGGTGLTATPSFGQILRGTGSGYALVATSSLGINTTNITEGSNLFWTDARFDNRLSATTSLPNLTALANLSITGSQVSDLNTLWDNRMSATTTLPNITTLANLATVGTITSGTWGGTTIAVNKGGTGQTSFSQGWLNSDGTTLSASTSPTVAWITATSTTATSTFALLKATTAFQLGADYLTDITGTGLQITNNALTLNATGDWTGTLDGQEGTYYLSRANHTGTQGVSTLSNYDWTFSGNYGVNNITGSTTMPLWAQGGLNASSTSNFVYASTTALTVSGNSYLGAVSSGLWNGTSISDAFVDDTITLTNLTQITNRGITDTTGTLTVARGGTGQTSFSQGWLNSDGTTLSASTSPTVAWITATSTTATSTFSTGGLTVGTNQFVVQQNSGNVGVGTTSPSQLFSVAGHCVTGDTRLRRRRRKKNGEGYDYDEVMIKDIQSGDEIASLDEKTGKIVWSKVNALMDMGVKKIYKLITEDGKTIRTTAEHPYLARKNDLRIPAMGEAVAFIDYANIKAWLRDKELTMDLELLIDSLRSAGVSDVKFYYGFDAENAKIQTFFKKLISFGYSVTTKPIQYFKVSLSVLLRQKTNRQLLENVSVAFKSSMENEADRLDKDGISLLAPKANFDVEITVDSLMSAQKANQVILFSGDGDFARLAKELKKMKKKITVVSGRKSLSGELVREADKFVTLELLTKKIPGLTRSVHNAKPARRQVLKNCAFNIADLLGLSNCSVDNLASIKEGSWTKVVYLKEGMEIAVSDKNNGKAVWDSIAKIEILPEEQVYDIEVDGTHNFIGNDIVAHNTYLTGGLGAGVAETTDGNITGTGRLSITSTTATSTFSTGGLTVGTNQFVVQQNTGNVGIGTTSPSNQLHVFGVTRLQPVTGVNFRFINSGTDAVFRLDDDAASLQNFQLTGWDLKFLAGGTEKARITNDGNVGIGTTSPWSLLSLKGSSGAQMTIAQADTNYTQFTVDASGNLTITPSGSTITIPDDNLKVCSGGACQTTALNSGNGNLTVENNIEIGGAYNRTCASGYVWVPGSSKFGTLPGFCTMKYEAKNDGSNNAVSTATGGPYVSIDQPTSRSKCEAVGLGYHLINEQEWMTIAENIAQTPINDMDDDTGLQLATGHSDNAPSAAQAATSASDPVVSGCNLSATMENGANAYSASSCEIQGDGSYGGDDNDKGFYGTSQAWSTTGYGAGGANKSQLRTHILSNGNVIWDIAGNVWEWTDAYINGTAEKLQPTTDAWVEYTAVTDYTALNYSRPQNPAWTSSNGIGQYYAGASAGQRGFLRGGGWDNGAADGVFTLDLSGAPSIVSTHIGFRCSR